MSIRTNRNYEDAAAEGDVELVMAAITYVGERSVYNNENIRTQGGYPALDGFQKGQTKIAKIPSGDLGWWERNTAFEISYNPEDFARTLLELNFVPEQITGPGYDTDLRTDFCEKLGIEPAASDEGWREKLAEAAGVDLEDDDEPDKQPAREGYLASEVDRSTLIKVVSSYDDSDELLDEEGVDSPSHLKTTAAAEWLADKDDQSVVDNRIDSVEMGQEA
jgi:hypothetical protein